MFSTLIRFKLFVRSVVPKLVKRFALIKLPTPPILRRWSPRRKKSRSDFTSSSTTKSKSLRRKKRKNLAEAVTIKISFFLSPENKTKRPSNLFSDVSGCLSARLCYSRDVDIDMILMSSYGQSFLSVGTRSMRCTTSMPVSTRPKTVCLWSRRETAMEESAIFFLAQAEQRSQ